MWLDQSPEQRTDGSGSASMGCPWRCDKWPDSKRVLKVISMDQLEV